MSDEAHGVEAGSAGLANVRVAIVLPYLMHYRQPVARALSRQCEVSGPEYTIISGTEIDPLAKSLATADPVLADTPLADGGIRWRIVRNVWLWRIVLWQRGLVSQCIDPRYDVIVFHGAMYYLSTWVAAGLARVRGKRVLMWSHGFYGSEIGVKDFVRRTFHRLPHANILYGHRSRRIMIERGFPPDRLFVIYNSLDYALQRRLRTNVLAGDKASGLRGLFADASRPVVCFTGRLVASKRIDLLLRAAEMLGARGEPINVLIVGDGPELETLRELAESLGLADCSSFVGACYDEARLAALLVPCALCVSPEGVGLTAVHVLAYGVPVVTHDDAQRQKPEFEVIAAGVNGDFYRRGDQQDLVRVMAAWLSREEPREVIRARCIASIERLYNADTQVKVLNAAVAGRSAVHVLKELGDDGLPDGAATRDGAAG